MSNIWLFNENCLDTMNRMKKSNYKVDIILTSPPYNISRGVSTNEEIEKHKSKYKEYKDNLPNEDYRKFLKDVFNCYDEVLKENGVILFNLSYASCVETNSRCSDMIKLVYKIIDETNFDLADIITWKKKSALPNNRSSNKLTRITEFVFVFCRKNEIKTFNCNKKVVSTRTTGQKMYENIFNFIEAKNNDGSCKLNKATYSSDLCKQLLQIYAKENSKVYDPFMGTGTTAIACEELGLDCFGSELSEAQVTYSRNRLEEFRNGK